jgi:hypothetical protein
MGSYRYLVNGRITRPCSSHAGSFEIPAPIDGSGSRRRAPARIGVQLMAIALSGVQIAGFLAEQEDVRESGLAATTQVAAV